MNHNNLSRRMIDRYHRDGKDTYFPRSTDQIDLVKLSECIKRRNPCMGLFVNGKGFKLKQVKPYKV